MTLATLGVVSMTGRDGGGFAMAVVFGLLALMIGLPITFIRRRGISRRSRISAIWCLILVLALIAVAFIGAMSSGKPGTMRPEGILLAGLIMSVVGVNFVFASLIETWTKLGARTAGQLEGLRRYLSLVDEGRMVVQDDIRISPQHFEGHCLTRSHSAWKRSGRRCSRAGSRQQSAEPRDWRRCPPINQHGAPATNVIIITIIIAGWVG